MLRALHRAFLRLSIAPDTLHSHNIAPKGLASCISPYEADLTSSLRLVQEELHFLASMGNAQKLLYGEDVRRKLLQAYCQVYPCLPVA